VRTEASVSSIRHNPATRHFDVSLAGGAVVTATSCIIATGGTSRPETGSTGEGFRWLRSMGHTIAENDCSLVPLTLNDTWVSRVGGVTLSEIKITLVAAEKKVLSAHGKILFTHVGVSGPTILNMSSKVRDLLQAGEVTLNLDLFPAQDEGQVRTLLHEHLHNSSNRKLRNVLPEMLPKSLADVVLDTLTIDGDTPGHSVSTEERSKLVALLKGFPLHVRGVLGADKAVVTSGGVSLKEIDFKTMESFVVPKLFLVGDVLDIDRPSGGYSLQLCWSTGYVAGSYA